ncbi:hypothetical protein CCACVL1_07732 [Corchorus capsularis]|uniref:Uncharacterized protein n=1 Tax=Corchorus capsularis TaxID=210143 RepID=A0A1R3J487_COCAP|nr:hypothetical protein CCACVL1_07732 [Corchorus capsularis]
MAYNENATEELVYFMSVSTMESIGDGEIRDDGFVDAPSPSPSKKRYIQLHDEVELSALGVGN